MVSYEGPGGGEKKAETNSYTPCNALAHKQVTYGAVRRLTYSLAWQGFFAPTMNQDPSNRHLPSNPSGRFQNSPFFFVTKPPSVCNIEVLHSPLEYIIFSITTTIALVQLPAPETNVGTILVLFCQGSLIFHLRSLVLDHARLWRVRPWNPAAIWSSQIQNFARGQHKD